MKVTILSKDPPGGRCTLYLSYARAIGEICGATIEVVCPPGDAELQAPALMVDGRAIGPADGLILSPLDLHAGLAGLGFPLARYPHLLERLEAVETSFLEGYGS